LYRKGAVELAGLGLERVGLLVNWLVANWAVSAGDQRSVDMWVVSWADLSARSACVPQGSIYSEIDSLGNCRPDW